MGKSIPLTMKERFVAIMSSKSWGGEVQKGENQHLMYRSKWTWDPVTKQGKTEHFERTPAEVRRLLAARKNHVNYARARKFVDAVKQVEGFSSGTEARKFIDEWRSYGANWYEQMLIFFIDAEDLAETLSEEEMKARILAEAL